MILVRYFGHDGRTNPGLGTFLDDVADAIEDALVAGDAAGSGQLRSLWLDRFDADLPALGAARLVDFLETRQVWREEADWMVIKTVDQPCIAYTAQVLGEAPSNPTVELIALGACYRYPAGSDAIWWQKVIRPRVRNLTL